MLYAIIADIHSNLTAFKAVLEDIEDSGGVDRFWCLGDIVGYGPEPCECIRLLKSLNPVCVAGTHDRASVDKLSLNFFNPVAAAAVEWTREQLKISDIAYLESLPDKATEGDFTIVHGSPRDPILEYISSISIARENFTYFSTGYCLCGHTHIPWVYQLDENKECASTRFSANVKLAVGRNRVIINPGSVGQPRDGDPRASYAVYDDEAGIIQLHRVSYDIDETQDKMIKKGLPMRLISRLETGS
ncbi:MAG: metallophosphoesterase family protein [Dehalococcoidales bacterium]|nr:metallophosphoesterase family protein [Dehalococcoidales bacterium]